MVNLLHAGLSRDKLVEILARHPVRPLLPPLGDARWDAVRHNRLLAPFVPEILRRADAEIDAALPELSDALYRDFAATGQRLNFERPYFARRRQFARAAVALLIEGGPRRATAFVEKLRGIFGEESWALPAHVSNPTGRDPLAIDLFAAETANLMGECLNVFGAVIPADLQDEIRRRLHQNVFRQYLESTDLWWPTGTHNWNAVCHQGVLGAALAVVDDPALLADLLLKAASGLPRFLSGYGEDGGCSEGPGYWVYGFGWFTVLNEQLETRTAGELSLFAGDEKIPRIASYGPAVALAGQRVVNFADCAQTIVLRPALLAYLGQRLDLADCRLQAEENYAWTAETPFDYEGQRVDLFYWLRHFLHCPPHALAAASRTLKADSYLPDLAVWIVRGRDRAGHVWELAAKGGHNDEHHNHNDLGSFILNIDGVPLITEIGAPEYVRDFFNKDARYGFLAARSLGHSVPLINGREQAAGAEYTSRMLASETGADRVTFSADLAVAYPAAAACRSALRTLILDKSAGRLQWTDTLKLEALNGPVESALVSHADEVLIESRHVALIRCNGLALELIADGDIRWDRVETHAYTGHEGQPMTIRRLVLVANAPTTTQEFRVMLSLRA